MQLIELVTRLSRSTFFDPDIGPITITIIIFSKIFKFTDFQSTNAIIKVFFFKLVHNFVAMYRTLFGGVTSVWDNNFISVYCRRESFVNMSKNSIWEKVDSFGSEQVV